MNLDHAVKIKKKGEEEGCFYLRNKHDAVIKLYLNFKQIFILK